MADTYPRMARYKTSADFRGRIQELGLHLPFDEEVLPAPGGPLAQPYVLKDGRKIGNRFCIHPMEGWDGTHGWKTQRADHPPLAQFRPERRETDLGRRGGRRPAQMGAPTPTS